LGGEAEIVKIVVTVLVAEEVGNGGRGRKSVAKSMDGYEDVPFGVKAARLSRYAEFPEFVDFLDESLIVAVYLEDPWGQGLLAELEGVKDEEEGCVAARDFRAV
jgi:hypothetical protein